MTVCYAGWDLSFSREMEMKLSQSLLTDRTSLLYQQPSLTNTNLWRWLCYDQIDDSNVRRQTLQVGPLMRMQMIIRSRIGRGFDFDQLLGCDPWLGRVKFVWWEGSWWQPLSNQVDNLTSWWCLDKDKKVVWTISGGRQTMRMQGWITRYKTDI